MNERGTAILSASSQTRNDAFSSISLPIVCLNHHQGADRADIDTSITQPYIV